MIENWTEILEILTDMFKISTEMLKSETSFFYKNRPKTRVLTQKKPWKKVKLGKKSEVFP